MNQSRGERDRDYRVILAWIVLALQILGFLWLLLSGRTPAAAGTGSDTGPGTETAAVADATPSPEATDTAVATAAPEAEDSDSADANGDPVLRPEEVTVDASAVAPDWLVTLVEASTADESTGRPAIPPHLLLTFTGPESPDAEPPQTDEIDLNQPQLRIIPVATLLSMLQERGDEASQQALEDLLSLLEQRPDIELAAIPIPPILGDVDQNFVSRPAFRSFGGGAGVGYVTSITGEDIAPVTNETGLNYVYQGLTADGQHYVFMSWPLEGTFLPETAADAPTEAESLDDDPAAYFSALRQRVEAATDSDLSPSLSDLGQLLGSLSIGGQVAATDESAPEASATADSGSPQSVIVTEALRDPLFARTWQWVNHTHPTGSGDLFLENPESYLLTFHADGTYSITADCNIGRGRYTRDGDALTLEPAALTRAACPSEAADQPPEVTDQDYTGFLERVQSYTVTDDDTLELALDDDGLLAFNDGGRVVEEVGEAQPQSQPAAEAVGLTGIALQWPGFTDAGGGSVAVDNPEDYTLILFPDGTFTAKADCNIANGVFTYGADGAIAITPMMQTRARCPEASQSDAFLSFLGDIQNLTLGEDGDVTMTTADGSSATFVNLGELGATEAVAAGEQAAQPAPAGELLNTVWQWTNHTGADGTSTPVDDPESYYLVLIDDGTYAFRADCNNGAGGYELSGTNLTMLPAAVTLAACAEGSRSDEFAGYLGRVTSFDWDDDGNLILAIDDGGRLTFANGGPFTGLDTGGGAGETEAADPLAGTSWQWTHFRDTKQDFDVSGDYIITFNADGTAAVTADCNAGTGTYSLTGADGLTVRILATTLAACPPGSLGGTFVEYLNQAGTFAITDAALTVDLMAEGGTMSFTAAP